LLNAIEAEGGGEIKRDYTLLNDIYHSLGACRLALILSLVTTASYALAQHGPQSTNHPWRTMIATVVILACAAFMFSVFQRNRSDTWMTMTRQVRRDLRWWCKTHPQFLMLVDGQRDVRD